MNGLITQKKLIDWGGRQVLRDAEVMIKKGLVLESEYEHPFIQGKILWNNRPLNTSMKILRDGNVESKCPCYANRERGMICAHVIALGLSLVQRATDPHREAKYKEELRHASRMQNIDESEYIQRTTIDQSGAVPAEIKVMLNDDFADNPAKITLTCGIQCRDKFLHMEEAPGDLLYRVSKRDESLLFVLEDICEGPARTSIQINTADFINILGILKNSKIETRSGKSLTINDQDMATSINMDLDRENGELILFATTELPFTTGTEHPKCFISGKSGWVLGTDNFWRLQKVLPGPYQQLYRDVVTVDRKNVLSFLQRELPALEKLFTIVSDLSLDLFSIDLASPRFHLAIKGSPASLSANLFAEYDELALPACVPDAREHFGIPDPNDLLRYTVRNIDAERAALIRLSLTGFRGDNGNDLTSIIGERDVLNFIACQIPTLRRRGWKVSLDGRISPETESFDYITPVVHVNNENDGQWFDINFDFEDSSGASISHRDVQLAVLKGDSFIKSGGRTILIDSEAIQSMQDVFSDCATGESDKAGHFRMSNIYAAFVKSSLDSLDGIDVEDSPSWKNMADRFNRSGKIEPVTLEPRLDNTLRCYQKDGVNWLRFLETQGFCGLLADEMGLGKTLQTLTWLNLLRHNPKHRDTPAIVICPTSLVENWKEEAGRFVPDLKVLTLTGSDRHDRWDEIESCNLIVTSYALLRRDLEKYLEQDFSVAVLDEAQHIKNRSTQNALAAKKIRADIRLVLTGTPVENSVSDLWSIMDFLMPGYLGSHENFRKKYELPISRGKQEAEQAQSKLRKKLHPFLMRRLKTDVASDLPAKIEKIATCSLSPDQKLVYTEILKKSQRDITNMVSKNGFNKSRMQILVTLMKLRQVCCHLDLLGLEGLKPKQPSSKMELFFELVDEALDGGHRILVFSQFVSVLHILRSELESQGHPFCYLDGSTKNRFDVVKQFNTCRDIPMFLISLKAGGTGLNLTGADMVIHFDPWWNPAVENQATDRAHRIGQKKTVYSIKMITKDTVEEKVLALQQKKKAIIDATIESDDRIPSAMSWEDIQQILEM